MSGLEEEIEEAKDAKENSERNEVVLIGRNLPSKPFEAEP